MKAFDKKELDGCKRVYGFTLRGLITNKANTVTAIILISLSILAPLIISFFSKDITQSAERSEYKTLSDSDGIKAVFIDNRTDISFDLTPYTGNAEVLPYEKSEEEFSANENGVLYIISLDGETNVYTVRAVTSASFDGDREAASELTYTVSALFDAARYEKYGIHADVTASLFTPASVNVTDAEDYFESESDQSFMTRFAVQYLFAIIVLILVAYSATYIIRAVLEEKASKLVETLMVSVKPLSLITGKILAVMTYVFGLLLTVIGCAVISSHVSASLTGSSASLDSLGIDLSDLRIDASTLLLILIALIISYVTYSVMAGIAGAACGSMEEIESANGSVMLTVLIGYLLSCVFCAFPGKAIATFTSLCPIISGFAAPAHYILGNISLWLLLLSYAIQTAFAVFLTVICSRVYAELIMHKGERIRLKEILRSCFIK